MHIFKLHEMPRNDINIRGKNLMKNKFNLLLYCHQQNITFFLQSSMFHEQL